MDRSIKCHHVEVGLDDAVVLGQRHGGEGVEHADVHPDRCVHGDPLLDRLADGAGNETPNRVLVDKLLQLTGKDESLVTYVEDRLGHDRRYSVDITKITELGWRRQRSIDEALEHTVAWYRDNAWWWKPLRDRR